MMHQHYPATEKLCNERLKDYSSLPVFHSFLSSSLLNCVKKDWKTTLVFQSFFTMIFWSRIVFLCFIPALLLHFLHPHLYLKLIFTENLLPPVKQYILLVPTLFCIYIYIYMCVYTYIHTYIYVCSILPYLIGHSPIKMTDCWKNVTMQCSLYTLPS